MDGGHPPFCEDCLVPLTMLHIIAECTTFTDERLLAFGSDRFGLRAKLGDKYSQVGWKLHQYLININIYKDI